MVQEEDAPASVPKVCSDKQYEPSQQVLSVLVRHTYTTDPENSEVVNLQNQLTSHLHHNNTRHINGKYKCASCGKEYSFRSCYEKHLKFLCEEIKKMQPKKKDIEIPLLPRLRIRKPAIVQVDEDQVEPSDANSNNTETEASDSWDVEEKASNDTCQADLLKKISDQVESSDRNSNNTETEASDSWDVEEKAANDTCQADLLKKISGPFTCACGKTYHYKSWYDRHLRKGCRQYVVKVPSSQPIRTRSRASKALESSLEKDCDGGYLPLSLSQHLDTLPEPVVASTVPSLVGSDPALRVQHWVVDSVPKDQLVYCCSAPYCGESFMDEGALQEHQLLHSDLGPENGENNKRRWVWVHEEQAVCGTSGNSVSAESNEPHTDYLSMIQISNVMSLVTSQDESLPMTEEVATPIGNRTEPEGGDSSSVSRAKDVVPQSDKQRRRSWVQKCMRNRTLTQQELKSGGRQEVCLLCGRRFARNTALDQHIASAHCQRFQYQCGSCNMSFKARTYLCRHVLQAHCDLKKLKCCVCKRRYRAAHHLQRHVLKQHSSWHRK